MPILSFSIRGEKPVAWGNKEWEWRRAIASKAREHRRRFDQPDESTRFSVSVVFVFLERNLGRSDLDNLAKPVMDTLFRSRHPQVKDPELTGALFDADDDRVFALNVEKRLAGGDELEGADISIEWRPLL